MILLSVGSRVRELRKALKLTQPDFAKSLGLTQSAISGYEKELKNVSEPSIIAICREYGVNEKWLRTGEGDMFLEIPNTYMEGLAREYELDKVDVALISEYLKLDKPYRDALKAKMRKIFSVLDPDIEIEMEVASYRKELEAEKKERTSASDTTSAKEA
nr:MAG TPA: helix-turn-helix domain protein [Caudoviricetes sp.]